MEKVKHFVYRLIYLAVMVACLVVGVLALTPGGPVVGMAKLALAATTFGAAAWFTFYGIVAFICAVLGILYPLGVAWLWLIRVSTEPSFEDIEHGTITFTDDSSAHFTKGMHIAASSRDGGR